ncbi:MAG: WD40 repeat domain-containing protein [Ktedonobacteraceae bacterium]|nr:WD40 repeat domain-containing protein [Ktedonobacteraceae bacterium]
MTIEQSDNNLEQQLQQHYQQHYGEPPDITQVWSRVSSQLERGEQSRPAWRQVFAAPLPQRRTFPRLQHIIEAGLAVALVASLIIAWLVVTRLPHNQPDATGKPLFTYTAHPGEALYNNPIWTPDGRYMTFALLQNLENNVQKYRFLVWDSVTGQVKQTLSFSSRNDQTHNVGFYTSPDGRYALIDTTGGQENSLSLGNILTGKVDLISQWRNADPALSSTQQVMTLQPISPNDRWYAYIWTDNRIHIWDIQAKKLSISSDVINIPGDTGFLTWSPDGKRLVLTVHDGKTWWHTPILQVWDPVTGHKVRSIAETPSMWITADLKGGWQSPLSPNGQQIITFNKNANIVQIRDVRNLHVLHSFHAQVVVSANATNAILQPLLWLADSRHVFFSDNSSAQVWDAATGHITINFAIKNSADWALPSDGGKFLIAQHKGQPMEIWNITTGRKVSQLRPDAGQVDVWLHNDTYVQLGNEKCQCLALYNPLTGKLRATYQGDRLSLSGDNKYIAIGKNAPDAKHGSTIEVMRF